MSLTLFDLFSELCTVIRGYLNPVECVAWQRTCTHFAKQTPRDVLPPLLRAFQKPWIAASIPICQRLVQAATEHNIHLHLPPPTKTAFNDLQRVLGFEWDFRLAAAPSADWRPGQDKTPFEYVGLCYRGLFVPLPATVPAPPVLVLSLYLELATSPVFWLSEEYGTRVIPRPSDHDGVRWTLEVMFSDAREHTDTYQLSAWSFASLLEQLDFPIGTAAGLPDAIFSPVELTH